ncbi:hypothetical protein WR25_04389 [Diploscapter pachys]|uniref:Uncharacterized protein n=1 Tax=Diploscapter pachys TaxID=2018661 RepID=A0A2A2JH59_9BILA|nr:hypothetical protein WR25_04389 [Diploscapter pachys]
MPTISLLMMPHDDPAQRPQLRRIDMEHIGLILSELGFVSLQPATRLFTTVSQFTRGQTQEIALGLRSPPISGYDRDIVGHFINCTRRQWRLKLVVLDVGHVEVLLLLVVFLNHAIQGRFSDDGILVFKAD